MSFIDIGYHLSCDTCDFYRHLVENGWAYTLAKGHEEEHGNHFVLLKTIQE